MTKNNVVESVIFYNVKYTFKKNPQFSQINRVFIFEIAYDAQQNVKK